MHVGLVRTLTPTVKLLAENRLVPEELASARKFDITQHQSTLHTSPSTYSTYSSQQPTQYSSAFIDLHLHCGTSNGKMASSDLSTPAQEDAYEEKNVHEVYQQIATHFSSTRYKVPIYCLLHLCTSLTPLAVARRGTIPSRPAPRRRRLGRGLWKWQVLDCKPERLYRCFRSVRFHYLLTLHHSYLSLIYLYLHRHGRSMS